MTKPQTTVTSNVEEIDHESGSIDGPKRRPFSVITIFTGRTVPPIPSEKPESAEERASFVSKLTWQWLSPLLKVSVFAGSNGPSFRPIYKTKADLGSQRLTDDKRAR